LEKERANFEAEKTINIELSKEKRELEKKCSTLEDETKQKSLALEESKVFCIIIIIICVVATHNVEPRVYCIQINGKNLILCG
jgi:hypothetical protein